MLHRLGVENVIGAREAGALGLLDPSQPVVMYEGDVFEAAIAHLDTLSPGGCDQPEVTLRLDPQSLLDRLLADRKTARDEGTLTQNAFDLQSRIAEIFARGGGGIEDADLAAFECDAFMVLTKTPETLARIRHMLRTGKPLRI
ncbi:hypothetical protein [Celeribacter persicus]|uniref:Uncharacterized protein n=1 Tax=Celeribacter persicus TaxID=1651082 RepID=A0A2T5H9S3_9RHOB|nr:hypothetical protein [Celeribacter persicus]PTQ68304.1 hypothetical protein C8N42_11516 [Celeribacter persicus]